MNDLLAFGDLLVQTQFEGKVQEQFKISKVTIDNDIIFNGCHISQTKGSVITLTMEDYLTKLRICRQH